MDLLCVVAEDGGVVRIYRLTWELVWERSWREEEGLVNAVAWGKAGREMAVGFSSGSILIISTSHGRTLHSHSMKGGQVTALAWREEEPELRALTGSVPSDDDPQLQSLLPRLSKLPAKTGGPYSQVELEWKQNVDLGGKDDIHHPVQKEECEVLVASISNGLLAFFLYGRLPLGSTTLQNADLRRTNDIFLHPNLSTAYVSTTGGLAMLQMSAHGDFLPKMRTLALEQMDIDAQLDYLNAVLKTMASDASVIAPCTSVAMTALKDAIRRQGSSLSPRGELINLLAKGSASPALSDWLLQRLGARGISKWEATIKGAYESICRSARVYLNPILTRLLISVVSLQGRSEWKEEWHKYGLGPVQLEQILTTLKLFWKKCSIAEESSRLYVWRIGEFCKWLQWESSYLLKSGSAEEAAPGPVDYQPSIVLDFLKFHLDDDLSDLKLYGDNLLLEAVPKPDDWAKLKAECSLLDTMPMKSNDVSLDELLDQTNALYLAGHEREDHASAKEDRPTESGLSFIRLYNLLKMQIGNIWLNIADNLSAELQGQTLSTVQRALVQDFSIGRDGILLQAFVSHGESNVRIRSWSLGPSIRERETVELALDGDVVDLKFYDQSRIVVLIRLLGRKTDEDRFDLVLTDFDKRNIRKRTLPTSFAPFDRRSADQANDFHPESTISVNGRVGREVVAIVNRHQDRICLFDMAEDDDEGDEEVSPMDS